MYPGEDTLEFDFEFTNPISTGRGNLEHKKKNAIRLTFKLGVHRRGEQEHMMSAVVDLVGERD